MEPFKVIESHDEPSREVVRVWIVKKTFGSIKHRNRRLTRDKMNFLILAWQNVKRDAATQEQDLPDNCERDVHFLQLQTLSLQPVSDWPFRLASTNILWKKTTKNPETQSTRRHTNDGGSGRDAAMIISSIIFLSYHHRQVLCLLAITILFLKT